VFDKIGYWGKELAKIWTNYLPPCRPSFSEMTIYARYLRKIQNKHPHRKLNLLILGSTSEFRDWGYEENLNVTVIDKSEEYHNQIKWEMKHKNVHERFVHQQWQNMNFKDEFDLIVGDLAIGNLKKEEISHFLKNIQKALKEDGFFMTKSFFRKDDYPIKRLDRIFSEYVKNNLNFHPFPLLIYDITLSCMDKDSGILNFSHQYNEIYKLYKSGLIDKNLLDTFSNLGWESNMKFEFYIPTVTEWEEMIKMHLKIYGKEYGEDVYSANFPIYIITKIKEIGGVDYE
jgi:ubiquinone/menaquinone biosynthesis C-methylase UbiE